TFFFCYLVARCCLSLSSLLPLPQSLSVVVLYLPIAAAHCSQPCSPLPLRSPCWTLAHRLSPTTSAPFSPIASRFLLGRALLCHHCPFFLSSPSFVTCCLLPFLPYRSQPAIPLLPLPSASSYTLLFPGHLCSFPPLQRLFVVHYSQSCRLYHSSPSPLPQPLLLPILPPPLSPLPQPLPASLLHYYHQLLPSYLQSQNQLPLPPSLPSCNTDHGLCLYHTATPLSLSLSSFPPYCRCFPVASSACSHVSSSSQDLTACRTLLLPRCFLASSSSPNLAAPLLSLPR
ncbi:hypothetical protein BHE74_00058878, partial [Ensete ventricosum]